MVIEGRKNLEFTKRALLSHLTYCSGKALESDEKQDMEIWDPEIADINSMLEAVEINLKQLDGDDINI